MKIEKNIPIPGPQSKYPFRSMEIGESVFFPDYTDGRKAFVSSVACGQRHKMKFIGRKFDAGYRIWRAE